MKRKEKKRWNQPELGVASVRGWVGAGVLSRSRTGKVDVLLDDNSLATICLHNKRHDKIQNFKKDLKRQQKKNGHSPSTSGRCNIIRVR